MLLDSICDGKVSILTLYGFLRINQTSNLMSTLGLLGQDILHPTRSPDHTPQNTEPPRNRVR